MEKLTYEKLVEEISKALFDQPDVSYITLYTGHNGMKDYLRTLHDQLFPNTSYTWRSMRACYRFLLRTNGVEKNGNSYMLK